MNHKLLIFTGGLCTDGKVWTNCMFEGRGKERIRERGTGRWRKEGGEGEERKMKKWKLAAEALLLTAVIGNSYQFCLGLLQ